MLFDVYVSVCGCDVCCASCEGRVCVCVCVSCMLCYDVLCVLLVARVDLAARTGLQNGTTPLQVWRILSSFCSLPDVFLDLLEATEKVVPKDTAGALFVCVCALCVVCVVCCMHCVVCCLHSEFLCCVSRPHPAKVC